MAHPVGDGDKKGLESYCGRILEADYSQALKERLQEELDIMAAFDKLGSPAIPYISAWKEDQQNMWYEFASDNLLEIMDCSCRELPDKFRASIVDRHLYTYQESNEKIEREVVSGQELARQRESIRSEGTRSEYVEAVYKISLGEKDIFWLKDEAVIEEFKEDRVFLSRGCLAIVTKEMEAQAAQEQDEGACLERGKLQGVLEMAGAVCHELNQPVMAISGYADIIAMKISEDDPLNEKLTKLKDQAMRVGAITQKLMRVVKYRTKEYANGEKIIDIDAAAEQDKR
jgi:C4-dicarboxylate-specific signal transduction histidine kinase